MSEQETFHPEASLQLINNMINTAKNKLADDGFFIIFWGWLITFCALANYITLKMGFTCGYWLWAILPPAGGIFSWVYGRKEDKSKKVKTYVDTYLTYVWVAFLTGLFVTILFIDYFGLKQTYFSIMILYGIATCITGGILNFRPLVIGSAFSFAFAILTVFLGDSEQFLTISGSLICSYIIPGHMLRSRFKSQHV